MNQAPSSPLETLLDPAETPERFVHDIEALLRGVTTSPHATREDQTFSREGKSVSMESTNVDAVAADGRKYTVQVARLGEDEVFTVTALNTSEHDTLQGATTLRYGLVQDANVLTKTTGGLVDGKPQEVVEQLTDIDAIKEVLNKFVGLQAVNDAYADTVVRSVN